MSRASVARHPVRRVTISIPTNLLEGLDHQVAAGAAQNRTDLIAEAIERELKRLEREAIDAEIYALGSDPEYQAMDRQLAKQFATSDRETWALLDEEFGPEPPDPDE
jgi:metal-responsive CopG/Arc/MetJ family transcriptional regulator